MESKLPRKSIGNSAVKYAFTLPLPQHLQWDAAV